MADEERVEGVLVLVCLECGKEYMFESQEPPELTCDKCGNSVFRSFFAETTPDDVADDFRTSTERDVLTTDPATDVTSGDLHDLGSL
jgi:DNA-directed RNA polymerase subunit RPC12/RpoP